MRNELLILLAILVWVVLIVSGGLRSSESKERTVDKEGGTRTVTVTVTTSSVWDRSKPLKEIDLSNKLHLQHGEITIYFEPEQRRLAQEIAQALKKGWQLVARRLGIALGAFEIVLVSLSETERAEIGGIYLKRQVKQPLVSLLQQPPQPPQPPFPVKVLPGLQSLKKADLQTQESIYLTMPHEALHSAVSRALDRGLDRGWRSDLQTRGLEEGLAEYIGHLVAKELGPEAHRWHLENRRREVQDVLQGRERPTYDLTREFLWDIEIEIKQSDRDRHQLPSSPASSVEVAGYGVALAFWLQIAQKHGEGVIKDFWQHLSQHGFPNAQEAARILSELTGEDIWAKLQNMDLHEVLRTLEAAGAPAGS